MKFGKYFPGFFSVALLWVMSLYQRPQLLSVTVRRPCLEILGIAACPSPVLQDQEGNRSQVLTALGGFL